MNSLTLMFLLMIIFALGIIAFFYFMIERNISTINSAQVTRAQEDERRETRDDG